MSETPRRSHGHEKKRYWRRSPEYSEQTMSKSESYKQRVHRLYKCYKLGLIKAEELTQSEKQMLVDWFGVETEP